MSGWKLNSYTFLSFLSVLQYYSAVVQYPKNIVVFSCKQNSQLLKLFPSCYNLHPQSVILQKYSKTAIWGKKNPSTLTNV